MNKKIKILIVDDSRTSQRLYQHFLIEDGRFEVVGLASDGQEAIQMAQVHQPDIISMDINMPIMDGLEATEKIMQDYPTPIVIVSSIYHPGEITLSMRILEVGAVNMLTKPHGLGHANHNKDMKKYCDMMALMSEVKVIRRKPRPNRSQTEPKEKSSFSQIMQSTQFQLVVIGASAGGPDAIKGILCNINKHFPLPILLVQHIDPGFTEGYISWLNSFSKLRVLMGEEGAIPKPGHVYVAPGHYHMELNMHGKISLTQTSPKLGHRPAVGNLFDSARAKHANKVVAVLLSGMGSDGSLELKKMREAGAYTIIQKEESCLVFGMPGVAKKLDAACMELTPEEIAIELNKIQL
jgi:two-component system chemotaxis response regulator CheB